MSKFTKPKFFNKLEEKTLTIFNYDFDWDYASKKEGNSMFKDECCKKYKKKGEKKCKKCPKRMN